MTINQALRHVAAGAAAGLAWTLALVAIPAWFYPFVAPFAALSVFVFFAEIFPVEVSP